MPIQQIKSGVIADDAVTAEKIVSSAIVGTVSQSSGVPTGAIIERGSNANGEFVKYADGTLICTGTIAGPTTLLSNGNLTITLPATFSNTTYVSSTFVEPSGNGSGNDTFELIGLTSNGTTSYAIRFGIPSSGSRRPTSYVVDERIEFLAIGRWF